VSPTTPDPVFATFGAAVREERKRRGLSQDALADLAQIHRSYLVEVERGRRNISLYNITRLARALDIRLPELFSATEASLERLATAGDRPAE
jgi:transcriptional regulator with XRE-family HTH domain